MSLRSGPGDQIYSLVGEGRVLVAPKGTAHADIEDDAVDYHALSWEGNVNVDDTVVTNTSDYNPATKMMNPRSLKVSARVEGVLHFHHNADPAFDVIQNLKPGLYYVIRLEINRGQLAVGLTDPAINHCYIELTEANLGPFNLGGGGVNDVRPVDINFMSNGIWVYYSEALPVGP